MQIGCPTCGSKTGQTLNVLTRVYTCQCGVRYKDRKEIKNGKKVNVERRNRPDNKQST